MISEDISKIKKKLEEYENRIANLERKFQSKPESIKKPMSIKEFIISKNPKSPSQKVLVIGLYLEIHKGMKNFTVKDIEDGFRKAKEQRHINLSDLLYKNAKKGFIAESDNRKDRLKLWHVTTSGGDYVKTKLTK